MYSYVSAYALGAVLNKFKSIHFGKNAKQPPKGSRYTNDQCATAITHYQQKLEKIMNEKERLVKETDIIAEIMNATDATFTLEHQEFVKQIRNKYEADLEKALGDKVDEWLVYGLDTPAMKDGGCDTILFEPKERIIEALGLTAQEEEINEFVKELYLSGAKSVYDTCAEAVQDHLDDIIDIDEKLDLNEEQIDQYL